MKDNNCDSANTVLYTYPETKAGQLLRDLYYGPRFYFFVCLVYLLLYHYRIDMFVPTALILLLWRFRTPEWPDFYPRRIQVEEQRVYIERYWGPPVVCDSMLDIYSTPYFPWFPNLSQVSWFPYFYVARLIQENTGKVFRAHCPPCRHLRSELNEFIKRADRRWVSEVS